MPLPSVGTIPADSQPAVVQNCTGVDVSGLPFTSSTVAVIADDPPIAGTVVGFAVTATRPTAALPTAILSPVVGAGRGSARRGGNDRGAVVVAGEQGHDGAAVDVGFRVGRLDDPQRRRKRDMSAAVRRRAGRLDHLATICARPLADRTGLEDVSVMVDPVGASRGTFSQPATAAAATRHGESPEAAHGGLVLTSEL